MWCWGDNAYGKLGANLSTSSAVPVKLPISGAVDVSVGGNHSCAALGAGGAVCWGANYSAELGIGTTSGEKHAPTPVVMLASSVQIVAGGAQSCSLSSAGAVSC